MPAAAVASRTPPIAGIVGTLFGLSGETSFPMLAVLALFLLRHTGRRKRRGLGCGLDLLDVRLGAQLVDEIRLGTARQEILQLVAHLVEFRNRPVALLLDL